MTTTLRLRGIWLQVHKYIGLLLAVLIIPISISGAFLVWHDTFDEMLNPGRYAVTGAEPVLAPSAYAAAARRALGPGEQLLSLRYSDEGGPIVASATAARRAGGEGGRPGRINVWLDPATGNVLDKASADAGLVRFMHQLHGSLTVPGAGRQIVGWVGLCMFVSCLTGLWLWWPIGGGFRRGFRWKRQNSTNANIHHLAGFWILLPLAMLSLTGAWISFPGVFGVFEASQGRGGGGGPPDRARAMRARPIANTRMTEDAAVSSARAAADGALANIAWPTDQEPKWKISFAREGGPAEVAVADADRQVTPPRPPRPETRARLMRRLHDGTGMGTVWQTIIFLGGIIPAILAVTGIVMWLRSRGWRAKLARKRKERGQPALAPAE